MVFLNYVCVKLTQTWFANGNKMKTKTLFRPVGEKEMVLIAGSNFSAFPPRLEWQPIFYPVLNEAYASEIASKWNTKDAFGNYLGFVLTFEVSSTEFDKYEVKNVGAQQHDELWVPAEELAGFNDSIIGKIKVIKVYIGKNYESTEHEVIKQLIAEYECH